MSKPEFNINDCFKAIESLSLAIDSLASMPISNEKQLNCSYIAKTIVKDLSEKYNFDFEPDLDDLEKIKKDSAWMDSIRDNMNFSDGEDN